MRISPLIYHSPDPSLSVDTCEPQRRAIAAGKIKFHALTPGHYPGPAVAEQSQIPLESSQPTRSTLPGRGRCIQWRKKPKWMTFASCDDTALFLKAAMEIAAKRRKRRKNREVGRRNAG